MTCLKVLFQSVFSRCLLTPSEKPGYNRGKGSEESHYLAFETGLLEGIPFIKEKEIFILEKGIFKVLAYYQKRDYLNESQLLDFVLEKGNPALRLSFNSLQQECPFIIDWRCPGLSQYTVVQGENQVFQSVQSAFARSFPVFILDLRNSSFLKGKSSFAIEKLVKIGLEKADSIVILTDPYLDIKDFAVWFDTALMDNSLLRYFTLFSFIKTPYFPL